MAGKPLFFNSVGLTARRHQAQLLTAFARVINSGLFLEGPEVKKLEKNLGKYLGGHVTTVASGHDALYLALSCLKLKATDEVIFPVNAYPTAFPVALSGARPVPVDVDDNGQLLPTQLKKAITKKTRAVMVVHLYGLVGDLTAIKAICRQRKLVLIEDCAQAFGSRFGRQPVGTLGDIGCFSFYPTKNLGTLGDGGAIYTRRQKWFKYLVAAKSYGEVTRYQSRFVSGHSRLPELQAAVLNTYWPDFNKDASSRQKVRKWYEKAIIKACLGSFLRLLQSHPHSTAVPHLLVAEVKQRNQLAAFLKRRGIETHIHYPQPVHRLPAFSSLGYGRGRFPNAESLNWRIISLPFHPYLRREEVKHVIQSLKEFYHGKSHR